MSQKAERSTGPALALIQGLYFLVTGIWPIVSIGSFQQVTGPKTDLWLVKTTGALIGVIGAALALAGLRREERSAPVLLGAGSAAVLGGADIYYATRGRISKVYLVEGMVEMLLVLGWLLADKKPSDSL